MNQLLDELKGTSWLEGTKVLLAFARKCGTFIKLTGSNHPINFSDIAMFYRHPGTQWQPLCPVCQGPLTHAIVGNVTMVSCPTCGTTNIFPTP